MSTVAIATNEDNRLEGFVLTADGALWHAWQKPAPDGADWNKWVALGGGPATEIVVGRQQDGPLTVFAVVAGQVQMTTQTTGTTTGWGAWSSLGGPGVTQIGVGSNGDGRLEVFGLGLTDGSLWHVYQMTPNGEWSSWESLGGASVTGTGLVDLAIATSSSSDLVAFALSTSGQVQLIMQDFNSSTGWDSWILLDGSSFARVAAGRNQDGRLEVFATDGSAGALWHTYQVPDDDVWSPWASLGNQGLGDFAVASNADDRLEVLAVVAQGLQHIYQVAPNTSWSSWSSLGAPSGVALTQLAATPVAGASGALTAIALGAGFATARIQQQAGTSTGWSAWTAMGTLAGPQIDRVVMVMLENRGFDSVLGFLYTRASPPTTILPAGGPAFQGLDGTDVPVQRANSHGKELGGFPSPGVRGANSPGKDPGESFEHVNMQLFRTREAPAWGTPPTMDGFLQDYCDVLDSGASALQCLEILRMFTPADLPILNGLAAAYAVSDEWFCSVPTQTDANRAFSICGTSLGGVNNKYYPAGVRGWIFEADAYQAPTIWNVLAGAGVSWGVYYNEPYPPLPPYRAPYTWIAFPQVQQLPNAWDNFHKIERFFADAAAGALPAFTYIEPKWGGEVDLGRTITYEDGNDYHPPVDITHSELVLKQIYEALRSNHEAWQRTLLVVVFDEHGGTYDHVPPPWGATPPWGADPEPALPKPRQFGFNFDRYGVRVPCILASPWIGPRTVVRSNTGVPFDHTSILASILDWQGIDRSSALGARVAAAPSFWHALTLVSPRVDDQAFPPVSGPALGTPLVFGQPFQLKHKQSGRFIAAAKEFAPRWFPTLGGAGISLELRGGYGPVRNDAIVQLRSSELSLNAPGAMERPMNTLGAWRDEHDLYYWYTDAYVDYGQQSFKIVKPGGGPGAAVLFGDEVSLVSDFPAFRGQAMKPSGNFVTTANGATDTWLIEPLP